MTAAPAFADSGGRAPLVLAEMAQALSSVDGAAERVEHVLELLAKLVPYDCCALLDCRDDSAPALVVVPETAPASRQELIGTLTDLVRLLSEDSEVGVFRGAVPTVEQAQRCHLALPLLAVGRVFGVVFVERRAEEPYDEHSLSLLTVVASMLATYLTVVELVEKQAQSSREIGEAHDFQQLLVGIVSHDLRNPLGVVLGGAGMLLRRADDARVVKTIERIISNAQRATRIINDLLDLTRARLGSGIPIAPQITDLGELLHEVVVESGATDAGRKVRVDAPDAIVGEWDPERIAQVVSNLLSNAVHYSPADTPVALTLRADGAEAVLEVHNEGPPIPPEVLPHIFDPFKRGDRSRSHTQGLGLGLYIVQEIVARHGGRVDVRSSETAGTTFSVILPLTRRHPSPKP